jgi:hypothetical protein
MISPAEITVKPIADSINDNGDRITTAEWTYPRAIHSEVLTHGMLRRNSASSRAIPAATLRQRIVDHPFVPIEWGKNQRGMQAGGEVDDAVAAYDWWMRGVDLMTAHHAEGERLGLHKQIVNRVIEPWMSITIIITATEWANFFHLRKHKDAEPHFQRLATLMWELYHDNMPVYRARGEWHLPMADDAMTSAAAAAPHVTQAVDRLPYDVAALDAVGDRTLDALKKISTGRCARVSYLTHNGVRDVSEDITLHDKLLSNMSDGGPGHFSPFEHPNMATPGEKHGPFTGWMQYRKQFKLEAGPDTSNRCKACGIWGGQHANPCRIGQAIRAGERPPSLDAIRGR